MKETGRLWELKSLITVVAIRKDKFLVKVKSIVERWGLSVPECVGALGAWKLSRNCRCENRLYDHLSQQEIECQFHCRSWELQSPTRNSAFLSEGIYKVIDWELFRLFNKYREKLVLTCEKYILSIPSKSMNVLLSAMQ